MHSDFLFAILNVLIYNTRHNIHLFFAQQHAGNQPHHSEWRGNMEHLLCVCVYVHHFVQCRGWCETKSFGFVYLPGASYTSIPTWSHSNSQLSAPHLLLQHLPPLVAVPQPLWNAAGPSGHSWVPHQAPPRRDAADGRRALPARNVAWPREALGWRDVSP